MRKADVAEWILSLATSGERAASIAGDLVEESGARGAGWFWWSVARTAASHIGRQMAASPWSMAKFAVRGLLLEGVAAFLAFLCVLPLFFLPHASFGMFRLFVIPPGEFLAGLWLAKAARGREVAAVLALIALKVPLALVAPPARIGEGALELLLSPYYGLLLIVPLLAGALYERRRALRRPLALR